MGTGSHSGGLKRPGRGVDHPFPSSIEVEESVELYLYSTSLGSWPVIGRNLFYLTCLVLFKGALQISGFLLLLLLLLLLFNENKSKSNTTISGIVFLTTCFGLS